MAPTLYLYAKHIKHEDRLYMYTFLLQNIHEVCKSELVYKFQQKIHQIIPQVQIAGRLDRKTESGSVQPFIECM